MKEGIVKVETTTKEVKSFLTRMNNIRKRIEKVDPRMVFFIERQRL